MLPGGRGVLYLIPALRYSDTHNETVDELYSSCRLLGLWRIKVNVRFHNSRCLRKVINNGNAVAVYRLCTQGQSISQTQVRNVIHILYKGELTTQTICNIFPSMCSMYWNKSYFNNVTFGTALHPALPSTAPKLFAALGDDCCERSFWAQDYDWRHTNALAHWYDRVLVKLHTGWVSIQPL